MVNVMAKKAMLATLSISRWGARTSEDDAASEIQTKHKAKSDVVNVTKRLLARPAMAKLTKLTGNARKYHRKMTKPWLDKGTRVLPVMIYPTYKTAMEKFRDDFDKAVMEFCKEYPRYIGEAKDDLGTLFVDSDYPSADSIVTFFAFDLVLVPCPDSADFRATMDADLMKDIKAELDTRMEQQLKVALRDTGLQITEIIGKLAERLKAYKPSQEKPEPAAKNGNGKKGKKVVKKKKEGKQDRLYDSLFEHVTELADMIPAFNLGNDPKLTEIHKQIVKELCGQDVKALKEDAKLRKQVAMSADKILKDVSAFL